MYHQHYSVRTEISLGHSVLYDLQAQLTKAY